MHVYIVYVEFENTIKCFHAFCCLASAVLVREAGGAAGGWAVTLGTLNMMEIVAVI